MKASRFTDPQKAFILKQGEEGLSVAEICRKAGISQPVTLIKAGKLYPPAVQTMGSVQKPENSTLRRSKQWVQSSPTMN